jgi:tRNA nucleotidyltransferase (CCA-adding enzyme)
LTSALLDSLRELPGGARLLDAASSTGEGAQAYLVGGSVRDLLRGVAPQELDVVVEGDIAPLLDALGGAEIVHDRFGTASVSVAGAAVDVTTSRRERYPEPGALPEVEPAPLEEDLLRRDFTVNAIAVSLPQGELHAAPLAEDDLAQGLLRVLHDRSFIDDPTRLWRLGRYTARLGYRPEERTAELAQAALAQGALATVSGSRIGAELRLALAEDDATSVIAELRALGVLAAAGIDNCVEESTMREALALLPADGRDDLLLLAALLAGNDSGHKLVTLLDRLAFAAADRDRVVAAVLALPGLLRELPASSQPSHLYGLAAGAPIEAVALAGALGEAEGDGNAAQVRANAERWLRELRHVRVQINGDDLIAAGVPQGPEIGRRLRTVLERRLDGELAEGREAELRAALEGG